MENFYIINNTRFDKSQYSYGTEKGKINTGNAIFCEECKSALMGLEWLPPFDIKVSNGKIGDFIFGSFPVFICSENVVSHYEKNSFKGIEEWHKVNIFKGKELLSDKRYYYPKVTLSNIRVDIDQSKILFNGNNNCCKCQKAGRIITKMEGVLFEKNEGPSTDIFITKMLPGTVIISENAMNSILRSDLTNISFVKAEEFKPTWLK